MGRLSQLAYVSFWANPFVRIELLVGVRYTNFELDQRVKGNNRISSNFNVETMLPSIAAYVAIIVFVSVNIAAAISDFTSMKIRNELIIVLLLGYVIIAPLAGLSVETMLQSALIALCILVVSSILFGFGWIGGGDAKLAAATSLWLGSYLTQTYLVNAAIVGLFLTLAIIIARKSKWTILTRFSICSRFLKQGEGVPYGVALAVGALQTLPHSSWFMALVASPNY